MLQKFLRSGTRAAPICSNIEKGTTSMRFLSIYKNAETGIPPTEEEMVRMGKLIEEGMKAGYLLAVEGCLPSALGARVRFSNDKMTVTDGPFTETKEVVGGFALLQADSKEEAIELVKRFLRVAGPGECEVRQVYESEECQAGTAAAQGAARG